MNIQEIIAEVIEHLRGMWRYRWWAAGIAWLIAVAGWVNVYAMPDVYRASAKVYVDTQTLMDPVFQGLTLRDNLKAQVQAVSRALLTRPNLETVARATDLDLRARNPQQMESLITGLQSRINVRGNREQNVFSISYQDQDRQKARAVVSAIVDTFVENSLQNQGDDAQMTSRALQSEIQDHQQRLEEAEARLAQFKKDNLGYMPDNRGDYFSRLQASLAAVRETEEKLKLLRQRRQELERQIQGEAPVFGIMPGSTGQSGAGCSQGPQIARLKGELASLQVDFTDKHPRIVSLKDTIAALVESCTEERQAAAEAGIRPQQQADQRLETNPVYQNLRIQLSDTNVEIASTEAQLAAHRDEVAQLRADVDKISEVETQLKRLNRDYGVVQDRYQELLKRRETLQSKERLDPVADTVKFNILEPPFAPTDPAGPNRPVLLVAVVVFAIGAGGATTVGFNLLKPVFFTRQSIKRISGLPVLGAVSLLLSPEDMRKRRLDAYAWAGTYVILIGATVMAVAFQAEASAQLRQLMENLGT